MDPATEDPTTPPEPEREPEAPPSSDVEAQAESPRRHPLTGLAALLARRGMSPPAIAASGLAFCTLAALCYVVLHPGLAGVLGLVGLLLGEIARASDGETHPLTDALNVLSDLAIAGGFVGAAARTESGVCILLGLGALILFGWLPYLAARSPAGLDIAARTLWRRPERVAILLLGGLLTHPVVPLLLVVAAGIADAWLGVDRLARADRPARTRPAFLDALLGADGSIQPLLRWGSLLIALLLMVWLPHGEAWRF